MNENDQELLEGLRSLAMDGPREAPARVEERLVNEFRRRARTRRIGMWASGVGVAAIAASLVAGIWLAPAGWKQNIAPGTETAIVEAPAMIEVPSPAGEVAMSFYALPEASELPPVENATVVRVELPMSSLRSIGFQINEERANEAVEADVLLGQDGLARGVRFVE